MQISSLSVKFISYLSNEKRFSLNTVQSYNRDLNQFIQYLKEIYSVEDPGHVTHTMVRSWIAKLAEDRLSPASVNRKISTLKSFFSFLQKKRLSGKNVMRKISGLKGKSSLPVFADSEVMNELLNTECIQADTPVASHRDRLIIEIFFCTGVRLSELINLRITDIDLSGNQFRVMGKRNKERIIPFTNRLKNNIVKYLTEREKIASGEDYFFITEKGNRLYPRMVYRIVHGFLKQIPNLRKRSPHILRHTFATAMLNNGAGLNSVKELLGHSSLAATQVYTHNSIEKLMKSYRQAHPRA